MLQELIYLFSIFIALILSSRCDSFVTVNQGEAIQLEFPYPCDSNKIEILIANRDPFYNSAEPAYLNLPFYQLNRFSVTDKNCSVKVDINPVKRIDEATYISKAYKDGVIQGEFIKIRLNVNYPPGKVSCTFSINDDAVGDWLILQCMAPVGSLAGRIYCYQDSKQLPPRSKPDEIGESLKQTIWVSKEQDPVFCCSAYLDQPKDRCDCKDYVWNPIGNISQTKTTINPCPTTTLGPVSTLPQYPEREVKDNSQVTQPIESLNLTDTNKDKSTAKCTEIPLVSVIYIGNVIIIPFVVIIIYVCWVEKTNWEFKKRQNANIYQQLSSPKKEHFF